MRACVRPVHVVGTSILLAGATASATVLGAQNTDNYRAAVDPEPPTYTTGPTYPSYATPLPPPPPAREIAWSVRFNPLDLVFGKLNIEGEYAFWGPLSITVAPQYVFADPRQNSDYGVSAKGWGAFGQLGFWIDGRPLRGYFVKLHFEHDQVTFKSDVAELQIPETLVGIMFGQQSIHAGWFTFSTGLGIAYDLNNKERSFMARDRYSGQPALYRIDRTGLLNNGVDFLTQLAIGGSF